MASGCQNTLLRCTSLEQADSAKTAAALAANPGFAPPTDDWKLKQLLAIGATSPVPSPATSPACRWRSAELAHLLHVGPTKGSPLRIRRSRDGKHVRVRGLVGKEPQRPKVQRRRWREGVAPQQQAPRGTAGCQRHPRAVPCAAADRSLRRRQPPRLVLAGPAGGYSSCSAGPLRWHGVAMRGPSR